MKKFDIIIIISFLLISIVSAAWFMFSSNKKYENTYAEIYVEGVLYKRIPLTENMEEMTIPIETKLGKNVIHISNGKINMVDADCHDRVCVKSGTIDKVGETIVCLPHKVVVEIKGEGKSETDDLAY
ncbi:NusG domain II-containing protein [Caloramator sp. E03]|uniref:NusG domain II-containing protein n=1 Tax=Caloramator sp. E03 TaxID=2576307 RepID=UPI001110C076|nr:NusG domain II-containing protein [Caloramator sp. E03]QCX34398.1 NusG domain II-containing protein [Caloramator sp. E03]